MLIEREGATLTLKQFEEELQLKWAPYLDFEDPSILADLLKKGAKLHKRGELTLEQLWLGKYFKKEILERVVPDVEIRWIDPILGWGVFAARDLKKMQFIAEYTGKVRKQSKNDEKNAYCFEYVSGYTIDALDQGGLSRFINHSDRPNLISALATFENLSHVIFYTKDFVAKGTQLCYDYGPDYWSKRTKPLSL